MPVWFAMIGTLAFNYGRHKRGLSTLCSATRTKVGPRRFTAAWAVFSAWMIVHYCRPWWRAAKTP